MMMFLLVVLAILVGLEILRVFMAAAEYLVRRLNQKTGPGTRT